MTELAAAEPLTGETVAGISPGDRQADDDGAICREVVAWLHTFESTKTRNAHASRLGLPADCRTWPGAPKPGKVTLDPNAWLPWCAGRGLDPLAVPRQAVESWLHTQTELREDGLISENTRRARYDSIAAWYSWLVYERRIDFAPTLDRNGKQRMGLLGRRKSPTKPLSVAQVRALLVAARHDLAPRVNGSTVTPQQRRLRSMIVVELLSATGMRADELCGLRLRDYRPEAGPDHPATLWIEDAKHGHVREVELPPESADIVNAYLANGRVDPDGGAVVARQGEVGAGHRADRPMITGDSGQRMNPDSVRLLLQRLATVPTADSGVEALRNAHRALVPLWSDNHGRRGGSGRHLIHPHQFRHAWAVGARDHAGADASVIAAQLGHGSISTSQNYLDGAAAKTRAAVMSVGGLYHGGDQLRLSTSGDLDVRDGVEL